MRKHIIDFMAQEKETTIYDLALKLDISPATVSRGLKDHPAISKKTKKKIVDLAEAMGYRANNFARNLRQKRTYTIGAIVPRLNSYFMASVIAGIEIIANKEGYNLIIKPIFWKIQKKRRKMPTPCLITGLKAYSFLRWITRKVFKISTPFCKGKYLLYFLTG